MTHRLLLRQRHLAYALLLVVSAACLFISLSLWFSVQDGSVISYAMGSWPPPWGIEYRIDQLNAFVLVLVTGHGETVHVDVVGPAGLASETRWLVVGPGGPA